MYSSAPFTVTLDGNRPTRRDDNLPVIGFIFDDVSPGDHTIVMKDVMGNVETASVSVEELVADNGGQSEWLTEWLADLQAQEVENPPKSITRYEHQGEVVYYVVNQCCDQYSDLLDADGNLIGHPDGGITGRGDGVTVFDPTDLKGEEVWLGR
ncbi:MAG: hypothetical protein H8E48_01540 [Chloroflexi bacterium]|nr:hypothetical protein [Chloroflexota bacterium]